jgi:hypothetical protein
VDGPAARFGTAWTSRQARRRGLAAATLLVTLGLAPRPAGAAELILYQANLSARSGSILANLDFILSQPFDGIVLNIPASWSVMEPGVVLDYDSVHRPWLQPLAAGFNDRRRNFVLAVARGAADPFDPWTTVIDNWVALARAARDAGCVGIFFDNEEYFEQLWDYPEDLKYPYPLEAYQQQYRRRGRELMAALTKVWPEIRIITAHGPYVSEPTTPRGVTLLQTDAREGHLAGHFFSGMLEAAPATGRVVDGGEVYQYRTAEDFARSRDWRRQGMARSASARLVPDGLRPAWPEAIGIAFGVYDLQWKPDYAMTAAILETTLREALRHADDYVWLFTEGEGPRDYLVPGGAGAEWVDAIARARATEAEDRH